MSNAKALRQARRATALLRRRSVAIGVLGQSNEHGTVKRAEYAAYLQAFTSLTNPTQASPSYPAATDTGGWWYKVVDDLHDYGSGYDVTIVNGAVGSMSMCNDACGQITGRSNSSIQNYAQRLVQGWEGDRGFAGYRVCPSGGPVWVCTTGRLRGAFADSISRVPNAFGNITKAETVFTDNDTGAAQTAASDPGGWGVAGIGSTIVDGTVTWTQEAVNSAAYGGNSIGTIFSEAQMGIGWDPFGIIRRLESAMQAAQADIKIIYIQNAQGDRAFSATTRYKTALQNAANYFLSRGYVVMIGLSVFQNTTAASANEYNGLQTQRNAAIATLKAGTYGARLFEGADLYALMGTTGPMGGWSGTASISSGVMTVTAGTFGAIEVGHTITHGASNAVLGTVASLGTYNGTTGTVILTGGVDTASTVMWSSGEFFQTGSGDRNIHINARGNVGPAVGGIECAGKHVADSIKAVLEALP